MNAAFKIIIAILMNSLFGNPFNGYTLITTGSQGGGNIRKTILIDNDENTINEWNHDTKVTSVAYLSSDSILYVPCQISSNDEGGPGGGPTGGRFLKKNWNNEILWDYTIPNEICEPHHDISVLHNGNILAICSETKSYQEAIEAGKQNLNGNFTLDMIIEIEPLGVNDANIVWEWHFWDHLIQDVNPNYDNFGIISEHPELLDINCPTSAGGGGGPGVGDWNHLNSIYYNNSFKQIVISSRHMNEFYVIEHTETSLQAASHSGGTFGRGGDFLYRWGNPQNYDRGNANDQILNAQHSVNWIPPDCPGAGNFILFNNNHSPNSSAVLEIVPPVNESGFYSIDSNNPFGPPNYHWIYENDFYSNTQSGAYRMNNGNTFVTSAADDQIFEVNMNGDIEWYFQGNESTVRALKYPIDYLYNPINGDLNQDSIINILDVILMTNIILEIIDFNNQGDINDDQIIDILDIILLINIILF